MGWVLSYWFRSKFLSLSSSAKILIYREFKDVPPDSGDFPAFTQANAILYLVTSEGCKAVLWLTGQMSLLALFFAPRGNLLTDYRHTKSRLVSSSTS